MTSPTAARPRAAWLDVRFVLGIALIVASVAGVWLVVAAARHSAPVFAAARTILPGQPVAAGDVRLVEVALGTAADAYLAPDALREGVVATRVIASGELVPVAALEDAADTATTSVVVRSDVDVPASIGAGSVVEIWVAPVGEEGVHETPRILVADAVVVAVDRDTSTIGGGAAAVEVVIPRADVAATLGAMADDGALSVVPATGRAR